MTVTGGELSTGGTKGQYLFDVPVEVVANKAAGRQEIQSLGTRRNKSQHKEYIFFFVPMRDTNLTAVFVDENEVLDSEPFIALSENTIVDHLDHTVILLQQEI